MPPTSVSKVRANASPITAHTYTNIKEGKEYICCKYCESKYQKSSGTKVVFEHLRNKHPEEIDDIINDKIEKSGNINSFIEEVLLMSFITGSLPFRFLENKFFRQFISLINSSYRLPNRHDLSNATLNRVYEKIAVKLEGKLNNALAVVITMDCWTSICWTAVELKTSFIDILKEWNIVAKTIGFVADNEPTMISCVAQLKEEILTKFFHTFGFFFFV